MSYSSAPRKSSSSSSKLTDAVRIALCVLRDDVIATDWKDQVRAVKDAVNEPLKGHPTQPLSQIPNRVDEAVKAWEKGVVTPDMKILMDLGVDPSLSRSQQDLVKIEANCRAEIAKFVPPVVPVVSPVLSAVTTDPV